MREIAVICKITVDNKMVSGIKIRDFWGQTELKLTISDKRDKKIKILAFFWYNSSPLVSDQLAS